MTTIEQLFSRASQNAALIETKRAQRTRQLRSNSKVTSNNKRGVSCDEDEDDDDDDVILLEDIKPTYKSPPPKRLQEQTTPSVKRLKTIHINDVDSTPELAVTPNAETNNSPNYELTPAQSKAAGKKQALTSKVPKTPNISRVTRHSFSHRKLVSFRKMSPGSAEAQVTTPMINRRRSLMVYDDDLSPSKSTFTKACGVQHDNLLTSDYTTPRTTRSLVDTVSSRGTRAKNVKLTHLIYQPLQLDTESSSESTDNFTKVNSPIKKLDSPIKPKPLAIEHCFKGPGYCTSKSWYIDS